MLNAPLAAWKGMHVRRAPALIALCCALGLTLVIPTSAQAQTPAGTSADSAAASQIEQGRRLEPLRIAANAAAALGAESAASTYSGVVIDADANTVTVYLTDRATESSFRRSMAVAGAASPSQLRFVTSRYSQRYLDAVREELKQQAAQLGVVMIELASEGSGVTATVRDPQTARAGLANLQTATKSASSTPLSALSAAGDLKIVSGSGAEPRSRTRDWAPWIAGEALSD